MTRYDTKIETCSCQVCRSDMAYLLPCVSETGNDPDGGSAFVAQDEPAMVEIFPVPLMM